MESEEKNIYEKKNHHCGGSHRRYFGSSCDYFNFGTAGIKLLSSKDAKKLYTNGTAAVLRAKECVMKTATTIQENAEDIYEEAKAINEERAVKEEQEFEETQTEEITEEAVEETVAE